MASSNVLKLVTWIGQPSTLGVIYHMRIGVLSDTHVISLEDLPKKLLDEISGVDLVVHAGDYVGKALLDQLQRGGNFVGVYGNMDPVEIRRELPEKYVLEVKGCKIGITHPAKGGPPFRLEKKVAAKFEGVDVLVYGHSHRPKNESIQNVLYFNPGSATGMFPAAYKSMGMLDVDERVSGKIIKL